MDMYVQIKKKCPHTSKIVKTTHIFFNHQVVTRCARDVKWSIGHPWCGSMVCKCLKQRILYMFVSVFYTGMHMLR
jgi:hypothetical protein